MLNNPINVEDNKREEQDDPQKTDPSHNGKIKEFSSPGCNHTIRCQKPFSNYFHCCNGFGHKDIYCRMNE